MRVEFEMHSYAKRGIGGHTRHYCGQLSRTDSSTSGCAQTSVFVGQYMKNHKYSHIFCGNKHSENDKLPSHLPEPVPVFLNVWKVQTTVPPANGALGSDRERNAGNGNGMAEDRLIQVVHIDLEKSTHTEGIIAICVMPRSRKFSQWHFRHRQPLPQLSPKQTSNTHRPPAARPLPGLNGSF
jgi:hypothetical protein